MMDAVFFETHEEFARWLEAAAGAREIWVGYFKKATGRASLTWSESVDVALCYGWIDGIRKTIDDQRYTIRFTPRRLDSGWSAVNVKKVRALVRQGRMKPAGLRVFEKRTNAEGYSAEDRSVPLSEDFEEQIKANPAAWQFLQELAPSYRRDSIWWVMSAKREETRSRRLEILITSSEAGLKIPSLRKKR